MTPYERQKTEIATIKPRTFTLNLSDADIQRIYEKAYRNGTTPAAVLEGFIGDLCSGTYTHGSDERMFADQYFERCCYDLMADNTFLVWALNEYRLEEIRDDLETVQFAIEDIAYYKEHSDEAGNEPPLLKQTLAEAENELQNIYLAYKKDGGQQAYNEGIDAIKRYLQELESMITGGRHNGKEKL